MVIFHDPGSKARDKGIRVSDRGNPAGKAPKGWYFQKSAEDMDGNRAFDGPYPDETSCRASMAVWRSSHGSQL